MDLSGLGLGRGLVVVNAVLDCRGAQNIRIIWTGRRTSSSARCLSGNRVEETVHGTVCLSGMTEEDDDAPQDKTVFVPVGFLTRVATSVSPCCWDVAIAEDSGRQLLTW